MFGRFHRHLRKLAHRALNELELRQFEIPDIDVLAVALHAYATMHLGKHLYARAPGDPKPTPFERWARLDDDELVKVSRMSAEFARERWSADYLEQMRERSRLGGRNSKRGPTKATADNLAVLAALPDDMTHQERADALGVSLSTEKRLWRQYQQQRPRPAVEQVLESQEAPGVPSGLWRSRHADHTPEPITWIPAQRRYRRRIYPGERA